MKEAEAAGVGFGELVPIGEYEMFVYRAKAGKTSNGKLRLEVTGKIIGGPSDGKTVWNQFVFSPDNAQALGFFFRHMAVLGAGQDWFASRQANEGTFAELASYVLGARFRAVIGVAEVNKENRNQFEKVLPSAVAPGQKMEGAVASPQSGQPTPSVPNIPTGVAAPVVSGLITQAPAPAPAPAVPQSEEQVQMQQIPEGATADIAGVMHAYIGGQWVPQTATAPAAAPENGAPAAPKAPF